MQLLKSSLCLLLALAVTVSVSADEKKGKRKEQKAPAPSQRFVEKMKLTDTQKEQVAAVDKEFGPKLAALNKSRMEILTDEQKQAEKTAKTAVKDAGQKGPEARKAIDAVLKLTDDQKTKMKEIQKKQGEVNAELVAALKKFLTPEQQEQLPKIGGDKKGGKKKKDAA